MACCPLLCDVHCCDPSGAKGREWIRVAARSRSRYLKDGCTRNGCLGDCPTPWSLLGIVRAMSSLNLVLGSWLVRLRCVGRGCGGHVQLAHLSGEAMDSINTA